jgi:hypothetical protein
MSKLDYGSRARLHLFPQFGADGNVTITWHTTLGQAIERFMDLSEQLRATASIEVHADGESKIMTLTAGDIVQLYASRSDCE